ncbi:MAG: tetratricopeptide repeat protein [Actinobacteria bacterium]|nr:MAG: tetratricopeptide repeat protein [Actinomycetota bacterium]
MSSTPDIPTLLAGYRIERELGRGGMGRVYEAEHVHLQRRLALKVLAPHLAEDESFRERFVRESRLLAAIDHPNIIPIFDAGEADGLLYIAMRYVDGEDLKALIEREGGLDPAHAVSIVAQIGDALDAAHARELVHRDVKPANILLDEPTQRIFLTDFGLARRVRGDGMSAEGLFLGTIDYAAPEQIEGRSVGSSVDVYALGCVLHECLTGKPPFPKETDVAVVHAHLIDAPPRVTATRPELSTALDEVVARALAKSADDRFATCGELAQAARAALGGAPPSIVAAPVRVDEAAAAPPTEGPAPSTLPVDATPFVGREADAELLCERLAREDARMVTLSGPGGTGKTRLAVEVARRLEQLFPEGTFFIDLSPVFDPVAVEPRIAEALGVEEVSPGDVGAALRLRVRGERLLLVLDNFEQVLPAAPVVAELLDAGAGMKVLATSRSPLRLRGEYEYQVPPLRVPRRGTGDVEAALGSPAVQLFVDRARAVRSDFELTADNLDAVVDVCAGVDGLPLAIELAAAWMKLLTPNEVLARFEQRLELLTGGGRDLPSRHQTLRGAIDWSHELLEPDAQLLMSRLAVFSHGWTLAAAEAVAADSQDPLGVVEGLSSLADASLVRRLEVAAGESRFAMLQTIQEYALYRLIERGEVEDVRRRHAEYFAGLAEQAEPELVGPDQDAWLRKLDDETANLRTALRWSLESGELAPGLRIAGALPRFWSIRGHMPEGRAWLELALGQPADVPAAIRARALFASGYAALGLGDFGAALQRFEEALRLFRELDDARGVAQCLAQLGWLATTRDDHERAVSVSQESLTLARDLGDKRTASVALSNLAEIAAADGGWDEATRLFEEALELRRAVGDRRNVANALLNLGRTELARGDHERAAAVLKEGLELAVELDDTWSISVGLSALAQTALQQGDARQARTLLAEALDTARKRGDRRLVAACLQTAAATAAADEDYARAARVWGAADALRQELGASLSPAERAVERVSLAPVRAALGDTEFQQEHASGRALELDDAIALALDTRR